MNSSSAQVHLREMLKGRSLFLVGMMGSGKTSTGKPLAQLLDYRFVDLDAVIEELIGSSISELFKKDGEESFRVIETKVLNQITQRHSLVIATGGGVVTRSENWGYLHQGIVVWLDPSREVLLTRLTSDTATRPLLDVPQPEVSLDRLIKERKKFYAEADLKVKIQFESPEEVATRIIEDLSVLIGN